MIHAVRMIGEYALREQESKLDQLVENPNSNGKYKTVLLITFKQYEEKLIYAGVDIEEFSLRNLGRYAYKSGSARGGDFTPTSKITDLEKTSDRIRKPLKKVIDSIKDETPEAKILIEMNTLLHDEETFQQIIEDLKQVTYEDNAILSVVLDDVQGRKYVGDFSLLTSGLLTSFNKSLYHRKSFLKHERKSVGKNNQCYVCSKIAKETFGYASTYAFYTLDKQSFTSGGFARENAWKNYPVCPECGYILEAGKQYIEDHFSARFAGMDYAVLPKCILDEGEDQTQEIFDILEEFEEKKKLSLKEDTANRITGTQDDLLDSIKEFENFMNFNIMFYDAPKGRSEFRILLYVEDVLPSYMRKIYDAKMTVEGIDLFKNLPGKKETFQLNFGFHLIANFFPVDPFRKTFLELLDNILSGKKIAYPLLLKRFMEVIRRKFANGETYWLDVRKAMQILLFLNELDLLNGRKEGIVEMGMEVTAYEQKFLDFFQEHKTFFDSDLKRAIFLEGVLAQKLLNVQRYEREGVAPFENRLNGLKLNEKIVRRLLPEIQNKLTEYKAYYYKKIEKLAAKYFLNGNFTSLSNDEMSFYFVMGLNLADEFKHEKNGGKDDGKDN